MPRSRQQLKTHRHTSWCADKVQPPPVEEPLLGSTPAEVVTATGVMGIELAASPSTHPLAHRYGHRVYDEHISLSKELPHPLCDMLQPLGKSVQPTTEAGSAEWLGDVAHTLHHEQGSFMVVMKAHRGDHCHGEYFSIANLSVVVRAVSQLAHRIFDDAVCRYNLYVVHVVPPLDGSLLTPF